MEKKYITVAYRLYAMLDGNKELLEEAPASHPFQFISGINYTLDRFEKEIVPLAAGSKFEFSIPCAEAYGERDEANVRTVNKSMFCDADGEFDNENIYEGNIIMLNDAQGNQFYANVGEITETEVTLDLNHPHAGKDLIFEGEVITSREATPDEIQGTLNMMQGNSGCGSGCSGCGGGCGDNSYDAAAESQGCGSGCGCGSSSYEDMQPVEERGCGCGCGHC